MAPWFSAVMSVSPRGTLSGAAGKNSHENLGLRVGAQESPVHFQKRQSSGEERGRGRGTDSCRAWKDIQVRGAEKRELPRY